MTGAMRAVVLVLLITALVAPLASIGTYAASPITTLGSLAVTFDSSANVSWTSACFNPFVSPTIALTVGNHANRLLVVEISGWSNAPSPSGPPTWNTTGGGSETFSSTPGGGGSGPDVTYYLVNPTVGSGHVVWSSGGGSGLAGAAVVASFYNVNQTNPLAVTFGGTGVGSTGGPPVAATPSSPGDAFIFTLAVNGQNAGQWPTATPTNPGATSDGAARLKDSSGIGCEGNLFTMWHAPSTVTVEQFTLTDALSWYYVYFDVHAVPSAPATPPSGTGVVSGCGLSHSLLPLIIGASVVLLVLGLIWAVAGGSGGGLSVQRVDNRGSALVVIVIFVLIVLVIVPPVLNAISGVCL